MLKKIYISFLFVLVGMEVFGQTKSLLFFNESGRQKLSLFKQNLFNKKINIDTTSSPKNFNEGFLKNYQSVIFFDVSINTLNFRQSLELQRFMQAGGGFVGIHGALEKDIKWLWYKKMLGAESASEQLENPINISLITNAYIGNQVLPPLWKVDDKPLLISNLSVSCKPVLLDAMSKTWSWYYSTEEGGKMFYTALGGNESLFSNPSFLAHIWSGIEEVTAKKLPDYSKISESALPEESYFYKIKLSENLENPLALVITPDKNVLLVEQNGNVKYFIAKSRQTNIIGKVEVKKLKSLRLDPEFKQNGYIYTFTETEPDAYSIGRLQMQGDSALLQTDFSGQTTSSLSKSITYEIANYENEPYRLPKYFNGKSFRYDDEQGFVLETYDEDGNLKNREPFLQNINFKYIQDMGFGPDGALYFLEDGALYKIDYSEKNRAPLAIAIAEPMLGNAPLKVKFSSNRSIDFDVNDTLSFEWNIAGIKTTKEVSPEFVFTKPGTFEVKLRVTDDKGNTDESIVKIIVKRYLPKKR